VDVVVCLDQDIDKVIDAFDDEKINYDVDDIISDMTDVEVVQAEERDFEDLEKMAGQSPVIKFVNYLISNAIGEGASDIHIEPKIKNTRIRYRIDGVLFETMQSPLKMHPAVVSRIKIMANLDISERRLPQDGKISVIVGGRGIDLRISTLPTSHGEKVVVRILDSHSIMRGLEHLGMTTEVMETFREQIKSPHGILLVTGPTGSGKSTTLYSALGQMDGDSMNISTVEDPVEYELEFCNQIQVHENIGMTFASALRSLLRQDPDIIMVGEIRDQETARIAVQAALTGHLVLSTLHTNDAPSSITRLVNIGIDPYLIAASLNAVLAQRLVRKICMQCKQPYQLPDSMKKTIEAANISPDKIFHGVGCDACRGSGYVGRIGIYELLLVDDYIRNMINTDASATNLRQAFMQTKRATLFDDGMQKVAQGLTTMEEILRVTESNRSNRQDNNETSVSETVKP
ncbi:MAG: GspE/PulE family protein, partial [Phycisphaerae bacterium]|nr:GspE/PulE family protein [Phycisphaerae bacterium]